MNFQRHDSETAKGPLSRRDIAHILAGLRLLQSQERQFLPCADELNELVHGEGFELFEPEEYDELCERLNFQDYTAPYRNLSKVSTTPGGGQR